ncbi:hypothetical protein, partial [Siminovitchia fortis]|uniref:hypothetical protein n=1 Tax=Siminovitchia fortis TaxID=254758 RepID=UPI001C92D4E2
MFMENRLNGEGGFELIFLRRNGYCHGEERDEKMRELEEVSDWVGVIGERGDIRDGIWVGLRREKKVLGKEWSMN